MGYMTPAEVAEILKIQEDDVMVLINEGKLRAIKVGPYIRIRETELDELEATCPAGPPPTRPHENVPDPELPSGSRWVTMRSGRARVRVSGSVAAGADMWPGKMRYPIRMPKAFMDALLKCFAGQEVPVGGVVSSLLCKHRFSGCLVLARYPEYFPV
jgi:excisionase family DNA binding protein